MLTYIARRLLLMIPTLLGMTLVVFFSIALSPGGIGASLMTTEGTLRPEERRVMTAYYNERYGLDKPYVVQYLKWLNHISPIGGKSAGDGFPSRWPVGIKWPDMGESFSTHHPVSTMLKDAVPITLLLELLSLPLIYGFAIWTGVTAARSRGKFADVGLGILLIAMYSLPTIWVGVLMIGFLTNSKYPYTHWFPSNDLHNMRADTMTFLPSWSSGQFEWGWMLDMAWHMCLPLICLSYGSIAYLSKLQRGALLEALSQDFVRSARAKGVRERVVVYSHAFRNSLMPMITVAAGIIPSLIGGSVIVEYIFGIQGMGKLAVDAALSRDRDLLMAIVLIGSLLQLFGYLISDLLYAVADPRVSYVD